MVRRSGDPQKKLYIDRPLYEILQLSVSLFDKNYMVKLF